MQVINFFSNFTHAHFETRCSEYMQICQICIESDEVNETDVHSTPRGRSAEIKVIVATNFGQSGSKWSTRDSVKEALIRKLGY